MSTVFIISEQNEDNTFLKSIASKLSCDGIRADFRDIGYVLRHMAEQDCVGIIMDDFISFTILERLGEKQKILILKTPGKVPIDQFISALQSGNPLGDKIFGCHRTTEEVMELIPSTFFYGS